MHVFRKIFSHTVVSIYRKYFILEYMGAILEWICPLFWIILNI